MSERDVLFPVLCGFGPKRHLHFAHYGIGQHILHLCGGSVADLVVKAAGAAARQIVTEMSSPLRFFSTSSKGGIFTKAVYQKVFDFWRKIITKA